VATLAVPELTEASGLVASRRRADILWVINDSGNPPLLFAARTDGAYLGRWRIEGARNIDWEGLAAGPCTAGSAEPCLFVGDVGDNGAVRSDGVQVYVVQEPIPPASPAEGTVAVLRTVWLRYPDGPRDCEALVVDPATGNLYLVEKRPRADRTPGRAVYRVPADRTGTAAEPIVAERVATIEPPADGLVTAADVHPAGRRLALRTYFGLVEYRLPAGVPFDRIFVQPAVTLSAPAPEGPVAEPQGEAVAYSAEGRALLTTTEGVSPPLHRRLCLD
jgi:hypothetical protein